MAMFRFENYEEAKQQAAAVRADAEFTQAFIRALKAEPSAALKWMSPERAAELLLERRNEVKTE